MTQKTLGFSKYHGAGNDFIMVDNRSFDFPVEQQVIAGLCHRHFGIGADGLILVQNHDTLDFTMRYFNADGRESTLCGNGGRCTVAFARTLGLVHGDQVEFMAADGAHTAKIKGEDISLKMNNVSQVEKYEEFMFADTGSPHYVAFVPDPFTLDVVTEGRRIRYSEAFKPAGTNVNFVQVKDQHTLINRTYERGVEDETLSCGTGSVAAALCSARSYGTVSPVEIHTRGGVLKVTFTRNEDGSFTNIWLSGPVTFVFHGEIDPSLFQ